MNKKWLFPIFAGVLLLTIALVYKPKEAKKDYSNIQNFEDCATAGFPVIESYPRQCRVPGGITFTEILSEEEIKRVFPAQGDKQSLCGNNICEDVSCSAIGCPIPETSENCPADCVE